ncbi:MAG TPA: HEAT repeat domain-containing protein, partial [Candidatus Competibacter sp.]|nr:HEAT repeat domain-containing protein [Candidatus Competibacter sp.]
MWINRRVFLFCALAVASFSHAAQDDSKPPAWQVEGFWTALNDEDPKVLITAIQHTKNIRDLFASLGEKKKKITSRLAELSRTPNSPVRKAAVEALGELGAKEQVLALVELLRDSDLSVRKAAVEALGELGAKEQVLALVELLRDSDLSVRKAAVAALGRLGAKEQVPALVELLRDSDPSVRKAAV